MSGCHAATVTSDFGAYPCCGYSVAGESFGACPYHGYSAAVGEPFRRLPLPRSRLLYKIYVIAGKKNLIRYHILFQNLLCPLFSA